MKIESDRSVFLDERSQTVPMATPDTALAPPTAGAVYTEPVVQAPVQAESVHTTRTSYFTPAAMIAGIVAIALLVVGGITVARAGIDGSLDEPVVTVAGFTATALLGLIELAFGLALLAAALNRSRTTILFFGIVGGVAALIAVFQTSVGEGSLALERDFAVIAAVAMGAIVLAAMLPTIRRQSSVRRTTELD